MKVSFIQLGCPKNVVDGEWAISQILEDGHILVPFKDADVVLINTCGFIEDAKSESLEVIAECVNEKIKGNIEKVIVFGCLSERYLDELKKEFKEVDGFFPLSALSEARKMIDGKKHNFVKGKLPIPKDYKRKFRFTPLHYAYTKIGDGCNHKCSFCAIPSIRGKHHSRTISSILKELKDLKEEGVKEAILVSQDTSSYGEDIKTNLVDLIKEIEKSVTPEWIRLLYLYPTKIDDKFIDAIKNSKKILPYFDIPFQHVSKRVLSSMCRGGSFSSYILLIEKIRKNFKDCAIRSTFIVGYPTEKKEDFEELKKFLIEANLDNVGFFKYSKEEGTKSFELKDEISEEEKDERLNEVAYIQKTISLKKNKKRVGKIYTILVDGVHSESDYLLEGRGFFQAPEIDGKIILNKGNFNLGQFNRVKIKKSFDYDLLGEAVEKD